MYDSLRKYYRHKTGAQLTLADAEVTVKLRAAPTRDLDFLVRYLQSGFGFVYDRGAFAGISYVSDEANYSIIREKLLPSIAFSVSEDEHAGWSLPDLHTYLVDGITVGGHTIREVTIVDNVKNAYDAMPAITSGLVSGHDVCGLHALLMRNLVKDVEQLGRIRTRDVRLFGIDEWHSLPVEQLHEVFEHEVKLINSIPDVLERAIIAMMWLQYRQFFIDGNKRVSRFMCNAILGAGHYGMFCVQARDVSEYSRLLADFYKTADADNIIRYTLSRCLVYFPDSRTTHYPD